MNRFIFLVFAFLFACSKDPGKQAANEKFQKLQSHMWKLDSIVSLEDNGKRVVSIPATMNSEYIQFTSNQIQYYYSFNLEAPIFLESDAAIYRQPNILEAWFPGRTGARHHTNLKLIV